MSDDFLSRWSRRKRAAEERKDAPPAPAAQAPRDEAGADRQMAARPTAPQTGPAASGDAGVFDITRLPSLDTITAASDITPFMQPGVPAALTRAALRRAWSADPAIRDFVGLAENSWDFTASDSIAGFGPLGSEEAKQLLARFLDVETQRATEPEASSPSATQESEAQDTIAAQKPDESASKAQASSHQQDEQHDDAASSLQRSEENGESGAAQQSDASQQFAQRRPHGGALPQ